MIPKAKAIAARLTYSVKALAAVAAFLLLLAAPAVRAQAPTDNGTPLGLAPGSPEGSYALSGFENVNLYNGGLSFSFPLLHVGGRGGAGYTAHVPIDPKWMVTREEWYDQNNNLHTALVPVYNGAGSSAAGYGPGVISVKYNQWKPEGCYIGWDHYTTYRWASVSIIFTAPDGTQHELVDQGTRGRPTSYPTCSLNGNLRGPVFVSKDESGMTFIADTAIREAPYWGNGRVAGYLKMPDGTVYRLDAIDHNFPWGSYSDLLLSWMRDPNGNKTTFIYTNNGYGPRLTAVRDSLNRQIDIEYGLNLPTYGSCDRLTYKGFGGAERKVHVTYGNLGSALRGGPPETPKQLFPQLDGDDTGPFDPGVITSIWLPDGDALADNGAPELSALGQTNYAFPTSTTNALGHISYTQYDYYIGKPVDTQDANGATHSAFYADVLDRATRAIRGANQSLSLKSRSTFDYNDANRVTTQTNDFNSYAESNPLKTQTLYDGMGRVIESRQYETAGNYIATRLSYDALGRVSKRSNPFRNGETPVWITNTYDELGRGRFVTTPDGAVASNSYTGNSVTTTDQAGKKQKTVSDALGRVVKVYEDPDGANWLTDYRYDALDDLIQVTQYDPASQVTQTRAFAYDSLKRLVSATNPENGTVTFVYDEQGNPIVQTDARGVSSHASYDALSRPTRRWYNGSASTTAAVNNSPALPAGVGAGDEVSYVYDSQALPAGSPPGFARGAAAGRLVALTCGGGSAGDYYGYDALGRATVKVQQVGGVNYQTTAVYNNGGARKTLAYPSGHVVNYNYDGAGRLGDKDAQNLAMTGNLGDGATRTYSTGIAYSPFGGMSNEQYGTQTPVYHKSFYNVRGQLTEVRVATTPNDTFWNRGAIINHHSDQSWVGSGPDNNGNLRKQDVYIPNDDQINGYSLATSFYYYDGVNRLDRMREVRNGADTFVQDYDYDRFGNRKVNPTNTWGVGATQLAVSPTNNRLGVPAGYSGAMNYDAAGNLTEDTYTGRGQRRYDAWNRMTQAWANGQRQTYTYDGNGRRVRRNVNGQET